MSTLRYAIIGCGGEIAPQHIKAIAQLPDAQLAAMADVAVERGAPRAAEAGCPFFADYRTLLAETHPDVVVICTPHPLHAPIAVECLRTGAHVLVEKPIAVAVAEADAMLAAASASSRLLAVSFQHRFDPAVEAMRRFIAAGELGALVRVECVEPWFRPDVYYRSAGWRSTWRGEGGGVLLNQAIHTLDVLCYLLGTPESVLGWIKVAGHAVECEDTAQAMLEYPGGALGTLHVNTVEAGSPRHIQLVGDRALLDLTGDDLTITRFAPALSAARREIAEKFGEPASSSERIALPPSPAFGEGHALVHRDFFEAIVNGGGPRCDGASGRMSLELANAITLSSCTQRAVRLPLDRQAYGALLAELRAGTRAIPGAIHADI
jgi:UDP-N-acetyl-2-amino-2-deoxyglucuronate dehydrogenase